VTPIASPRRRFLLIALFLSMGVHLVAAGLIIFLPRAWPREAEPKDRGTVELVMVEKKGAGPIDAAKPAERNPAPPKQAEAPKTEPPKTEAPKTEPPKAEPPKAATPAPKAVPAPPVIGHGEDAVPPPAQPPPQPAKQDPKPPPKPVEAKPVPPRPQEAPVFDLSGTESDSNAIAMGPNILPATPDDRFHNRPPVYPIEAQLHNEHGLVVVVIHVAANGVASGVDVQQSSGVDILDQAAVAAVRKWRFRPAIKDGQAVPFDFPFEFIFEPH
jgi:protein TonB